MSLKLLLDENISPQVAMELRRSGYDIVHLRDVGLKGCKDSELMAFARKTERCMVTLDADFADLRYYPVGSHSGIIRLRLKFAPSNIVVSALRSLLPKLAHIPLEKGALVVSDGKRYRVKLPKEV
jgi:predicted nuclease of predicted toxin-antitoxin system